jgi:hypothetical protein
MSKGMSSWFACVTAGVGELDMIAPPVSTSIGIAFSRQAGFRWAWT